MAIRSPRARHPWRAQEPEARVATAVAATARAERGVHLAAALGNRSTARLVTGRAPGAPGALGLIARQWRGLPVAAGLLRSAVHARVAPMILRDCGAEGEVSTVAHSIANGHAWDKHSGGDFKDRAAFAKYVHKIIASPSMDKALKDGRHAYRKWGETVIVNPHDPDGGTSFQSSGKYYDKLT